LKPEKTKSKFDILILFFLFTTQLQNNYGCFSSGFIFSKSAAFWNSRNPKDFGISEKRSFSQDETSALKRKRHGPSLAERVLAHPDYLIAEHGGTLKGQEMSFSPQARNSEAYATVKQALALAATKFGDIHYLVDIHFKSFPHKHES